MESTTIFKYLNEVRYNTLKNWSVGSLLSEKTTYNDGFVIEPIGNLITRNRSKEIIEDHKQYKQVTIRLYGKGVVQRGDEQILGKNIQTKNQFRVSKGQFIMSKIDARNGAFGIVPAELDGAVTTQDFLSYNVNTEKILPDFFNLITGTKHFSDLCQRASSGTTGRQRVSESMFLAFGIPVPDLSRQQQLVDRYTTLINRSEAIMQKSILLDKEKDSFIINELGLIKNKANEKKGRFFIVRFDSLTRWDVWNHSLSFKSVKFKFQEFRTIVTGTPKYGANVKSIPSRSDIRYIRITDINEEGFLNDEFASAVSVDSQYLLNDYDFLIARSGNTVGKTFLYRNEFGKAIYAGYLIKYTLNRDLVNPYFVLYYTKSAPFKEWIASNQRVSAQPNINAQEYLTAPFVIPPMELQNKIVKKLGVLYRVIKKLKKESEDTKALAQKNFENSIFNTYNAKDF